MNECVTRDSLPMLSYARAQGDRLSPVGASLRCDYPRIGTQEALGTLAKTDESLRL